MVKTQLPLGVAWCGSALFFWFFFSGGKVLHGARSALLSSSPSDPGQ